MKKLFSAPDLLLLTTTMIWGWTFIIVKRSIATIDPYFFIFIRFLLALIVLGLIFHPKFKEHWRSCLKPGIFLGLILGLAFFAQTLGLKYTTASASGFITGLSVVLVAVFASVICRKMPRPPVLIGIISATAGLLLISFRGSLVFQTGDLLTLACAVLFALHVTYTERYARGRSASILTIIQFSTVTLMSGIAFCRFAKPSISMATFSWFHWFSIIYCGVLATAIAYLFQTKAQQKIPPFRTAVLLATEPLFAGIFAISLRFDPFDWKVVAGGALILCGMILTNWDTKSEPKIPSGIFFTKYR